MQQLSSLVRTVTLAVALILLAPSVGAVVAIGQQADTSRPSIPPITDVPDDSLHVVMDPNDTVLVYYRTYVHVLFRSEATGPSVRAVITKYDAVIVGGIPWLLEYTFKVPDPGPSWEAVQARIASLKREPGVESAGPARRSGYSAAVD